MSSDSCCPPGSLPALTPDNARTLDGAEVDCDGVPAYVVTPPAGSATGALVVLHDVHGWRGGRVRSVCDQLARHGFAVVLPDLYRGGGGVNDYGGFATETGKDFLRRFTPAVLKMDMAKVARYCRGRGWESLGTFGHCWGAWAMAVTAAETAPVGQVTSHPSLHVGEVLGLGFPPKVAVALLRGPQLFMPAGNDPAAVKTGGELVNALGDRVAVHEYPDMAHGWVPRGDASVPAVARDVGDAVSRTGAFFAPLLTVQSRPN